MRAEGEAARVFASAWGTMRLRACRNVFSGLSSTVFHRVVHSFSCPMAKTGLVHYCGSPQRVEAKGPRCSESFPVFPSHGVRLRASSSVPMTRFSSTGSCRPMSDSSKISASASDRRSSTPAQELGADLGRATSLITLLGEAGVLIPEGADTGVVPKGSPAFAAARSYGLSPDRVSQALAARPVLVTGPLRAIAEGHLAATG